MIRPPSLEYSGMKVVLDQDTENHISYYDPDHEILLRPEVSRKII